MNRIRKPLPTLRTSLWTALATALALLPPLGMLGASGSVQAQAYPARPVRIIVPFTAGGNTDVMARPLAAKLTETMGQPFLIENRGGANTIVGAEVTVKSPADGYTLLVAPQNLLCINPHTYRKLPYDVQRDFTPIALLIEYNYLLVSNVGFAQKTTQEVIAYAKANPGKLSHGSTGEGSSSHVAQLQLEQMAGVKINHIPYKGNAQMITDLLGGNLDVAMMGLASIQPLVKAGKLRMIAAAADKRFAEYPDLPTMAEAGYPGFNSGTWFSMVARSGTPREVITRLNQEINKAMQSTGVKTALEAQKVNIANGSPEDLAKKIAFESARWEKVVKTVGLSFE